MSCLYILEIKPLSLHHLQIFANIFSHSVGCLFILFMVSFAVQKLIPLTGFHLFIFAFISCLERLIEESIAGIYVREFLPLVSIRLPMTSFFLNF